MFSVEVVRKKGVTRINLSGALVRDNVFRLKEYFVTAFHSEDHSLELCLDNVTEVDMLFLQALCSLHRSYFKAGKSFAIRGAIADNLKQQVKEAGWSQYKDCVFRDYGSCLLEQ